MAEIINPTKVALPIGEESWDLDLLRGNFQKLNDLMPAYSRAYSTINGNTIDLTASRFTKLKVGTIAIVNAEIKGTVKAAQTMSIPGSVNTALSIAGVVPAGYQPSGTLNMQQGPVFSGEARGDNMQGGISGQALLLRSVGAAFDRKSDSGNLNLTWNVTYAAAE